MNYFLAYERLRNDIKAVENGFATGGRIQLSPKEIKANSILMSIKNIEVCVKLKKL